MQRPYPEETPVATIDLLAGHALLARFDENRSENAAMHRHPHGELAWIREGHLLSESENARWLIPAGLAYWVPSGIPHGGSLSNCSGIRVYIEASLAQTYAPEIPIAFGATPVIVALVQRWGESLSLPSGRERRPLDEHILAVLADEMRRSATKPVLLPMPEHRTIRRVMAEWAVTCEERASLDALAERCALSRRTFTRLFRQQTGLSAGAWMQTARILQGCNLMAEGVSVTETAIRLGYDSVSSFFNLCRRYTGQNPSTLARNTSR